MGKPKKVLFFIFEGPTDITSLGGYLEKIFDSDICKVIARSTHGDITSSWETSKDDVLDRIKGIVDRYRRNFGLAYGDFIKIVQVIDTDGAYASEKRIIASNQVHPFIDVGKGIIKTRDRFGIADRNLDKSELVNFLVECDEIENVPFCILYMSSDLEHVLHNRPNCTNSREKEKLAKKFAFKFLNDLPGFVNFMTESDFAVKGDYLESWDYIRDSENDARSLERHTNFGLLFDDGALCVKTVVDGNAKLTKDCDE